MALDYVRNSGNVDLLPYANAIVVIAVASILLTSPIGAVLIMELGPKLLSLGPSSFPDNLQETFTET